MRVLGIDPAWKIAQQATHSQSGNVVFDDYDVLARMLHENISWKYATAMEMVLMPHCHC
jgi:hypothetical protein